MEAEIAEIGSNPSVKELAKKALSKVPERYVLPNIDPPILSKSDQIPVIDLANLFLPPELEKLHLACKQWGFFQVINHGIDMEVVEDVKRGAEELFNLSMEDKKKLWQREGDMEGFGQMISKPKDEPSYWVDGFYILTLPSYLRKPHLFPNLPLPFRENLEVYCKEMRELAMKLYGVIGEALDIGGKEIKESIGEAGQAIRINYYPPCPQPENVLGLRPHTDASALTILLQGNEVEGLQLKKDGTWIPVHPLPNAFMVFIGDVLEVVTNGIYKSSEHRAVVNSLKERFTIATFSGPEWNGKIGPAPSLVTPETPALFKTIGVADFYKGYLSPEHQGKSFINNVLRINSENTKY
ncbi:probable 2-oxoglutarate/Fe(II)-dependent dioxygenase [Vigna radiata var. radiata]|uniref:Probable 2-oxoglutarate/Fe(II)-dependent dioxygenase n=1 Tax=Vigna radiata var. radiata TaxID=3916 RepID=A0A1S3VNB6_VIGRR|nr:probable 2-oxoglutarate/Fe(II)-dependent dioxygenase [Vigna radiata var. radiata]